MYKACTLRNVKVQMHFSLDVSRWNIIIYLEYGANRDTSCIVIVCTSIYVFSEITTDCSYVV